MIDIEKQFELESGYNKKTDCRIEYERKFIQWCKEKAIMLYSMIEKGLNISNNINSDFHTQ